MSRLTAQSISDAGWENYVNLRHYLSTTVALGLTLVRLLLGELGNDGYGLIALLGSTIGLSAFLRDVVRRSSGRNLPK